MNHLQTDKGKEWYNERVRNLLKQYNINHNHIINVKADVYKRQMLVH